MKTILISIHPKWVAKILNGQKRIEVRKTGPQGPGPFEVYIYCTKDQKNGLYWAGKWACINQKDTIPSIRNGKIVAKCRCYIGSMDFRDSKLDDGSANYILEDCRLTLEQARRYQGDRPVLRLWNIEKLEVFDKPKELSEFFHGFKLKNNGAVLFDYDSEALRQRTLWGYEYSHPLKKAPQSWCYMEVRQ